MIPVTPSLCNNIMSGASLNTKDAHSRKTKEKKKNKVPIEVNRLTTARAPPVVMTPILRKRFSKTTPLKGKSA
jgi:hypothetical protein